MTENDRTSTRGEKSLRTRERLLGAAVAEFKREGMSAADVAAIVSAAGVAHGTFFYYFPTKEHVLHELENREEQRMGKAFRRFLAQDHTLAEALTEAARLVVGLERRFGRTLFRDFLVVHFSQTRPRLDEGSDHPMIFMVADRIRQAHQSGDTHREVVPMNTSIFFLLGLYALLLTTFDWPNRDALVDDYVRTTVRSLQAGYLGSGT